MAVSQTFKNAVFARDLLKIRLLMCNELLLDPTFRSFSEMQKEVEGISELYVPFDGSDLDTDSAKWNNSYLGLQQTKLVSNFCPERIEHVKEIIRKLHPPKAPSATQTYNAKTTWQNSRNLGDAIPHHHRPVDYEEQKRADAASGKIIKVVGCGVGGAAIGGLATWALIAEGSIVSGALVGAAIGFTIGYLIVVE